MRHIKKGRKFGRTPKQRRSLLRNLMFSLVMKERVQTSEAKAKEIRPKIEQLITLAKGATIHSRRLLAERLPEAAAKKLARDVALRYKDRGGGYTRIMKVGVRKSDASRQAIIELVK